VILGEDPVGVVVALPPLGIAANKQGWQCNCHPNVLGLQPPEITQGQLDGHGGFFVGGQFGPEAADFLLIFRPLGLPAVRLLAQQGLLAP
jgi:hypothetical protein